MDGLHLVREWLYDIFIGVGGGVIDYDFTGNVTVILFNHGEQMFRVEKGDRIAQLILEKISQPVIVEVNSIQKTVRGANRFWLDRNLKAYMPYRHKHSKRVAYVCALSFFSRLLYVINLVLIVVVNQ